MRWGNFGGKGRPTVKYRDTLRSPVRKRLNRSWCRFYCGLRMAQGIMSWMGSRSRYEKGQFGGERAANCKVWGLSAMSCAEMAEPMDLPSGLWTRVGRRKHRFNHIRQVTPMCPHERAYWCHLANMIESSVCMRRRPRSYVKLLWPLVLVSCGSVYLSVTDRLWTPEPRRKKLPWIQFLPRVAYVTRMYSAVCAMVRCLCSYVTSRCSVETAHGVELIFDTRANIGLFYMYLLFVDHNNQT